MKGGIRPDAEMELAGMDMPEMGALGYADFALNPTTSSNGSEAVEEEPTPVGT